MSRLKGLLPELDAWNDGKGILPIDWLHLVTNSATAVAFAELFWPTFVEFEGYVLRDDFSLSSLREWEKSARSRANVEGPMNTIHLVDLFVPNGEDWSEIVDQRAIHLGRTLRDVYEAKLARDFPGKSFVIELWEGDQPGNDEISLSFWQF